MRNLFSRITEYIDFREKKVKIYAKIFLYEKEFICTCITNTFTINPYTEFRDITVVKLLEGTALTSKNIMLMTLGVLYL